MTQSAILAIIIMAGWLVLARLARTLRRRQRQRALWALVIAGVPILGWLTYTCGPWAGIGFLALGLLVLIRLPMRARTRATP
ncbi:MULTISPECIES: DUF2484 family protein [Paracoccus]|uniref:DUF2484 family protein n=1 Tax=Paracoccus fontiphilus TaxID=1815556 RepID=A0ABV7IBA7_9RHOB